LPPQELSAADYQCGDQADCDGHGTQRYTEKNHGSSIQPRDAAV